MRCLRELEGLDFIFFPFNFIHSRVAYTEFLPAAIARNIGLLAMKPLGSGSIVLLDPDRPRKDARPESERLSLNFRNIPQQRMPLLAEAVDKLTGELDRQPDETLAQAALRFVFAKPFLTCALPGMWLDEELEENYQALTAYAAGQHAAAPALAAAARVAALSRQAWLPRHYRWLDQRWRTQPLQPS
jgi:aryl-alcohol dehydrogenase-like predicted oxidoreductase